MIREALVLFFPPNSDADTWSDAEYQSYTSALCSQACDVALRTATLVGPGWNTSTTIEWIAIEF